MEGVPGEVMAVVFPVVGLVILVGVIEVPRRTPMSHGAKVLAGILLFFGLLFCAVWVGELIANILDSNYYQELIDFLLALASFVTWAVVVFWFWRERT